jgi:hypothetical protein
MDYISSLGLKRCLATAVITLLLQPAYAQQQGFAEPPLFLEHDVAMQPVDSGTTGAAGYAQESRQQPTDQKLPPRQPDLTFGEYRSWEVGVGTRKSVGVMIKRDFH